jgi:sRNA-binding protein
MVPYLHGNPAWSFTRDNNKQQQQQNQHQRAHYQAKEWMEENCNKNSKSRIPHIGSVEEFASSTNLNIGSEYNIYTFTSDGNYPTANDVSSVLEDKAVSIICSVMNWKIPSNWKQVRKRIVDLHDIPILNLDEWDVEQQQQQLFLQKQQQQEQQECQHESKMEMTNDINVDGDTTTIYTNNNNNNNNDHRGDDDDYADGRPDRNDDNNDDGWRRRANKVQRNDTTTVGNDNSSSSGVTVSSNNTLIVDGEGVVGSGGTNYARCVTAEDSG